MENVRTGDHFTHLSQLQKLARSHNSMPSTKLLVWSRVEKYSLRSFVQFVTNYNQWIWFGNGDFEKVSVCKVFDEMHERGKVQPTTVIYN